MSVHTGSRRHAPARPAVDSPATRREPASTEGRTRGTVLRLIAEHGPVTAAEVAETLDITPTAVRRHVGALELDGLVAEQEQSPLGAPRGRGRPARTYVVTSAGHARMASSYDDIANEALRYLVDKLGPEAVEEFARQRAERLLDRYAPIVQAAGEEPTARAEALAAALSSDGFAATARSVEGPTGVASHGVQLCQGHCPVQTVAAEYSEFCEAEKDAFAELLGVHVQRLSTLAGGGHVCTTFVPSPTVRPGARTASTASTDRTPTTEIRESISERTPR